MTKTEREAFSRLLLGVRMSLEAAHETVSGVMQLLNAGVETEAATPPAPRRPRYMGDTDNESPESGR